jgi:hypothetical protein
MHGGIAGLRKEGEREVMARRGDRAMSVHAHAARCSSDVAVAATLHGGDAEGVCPYAVGTGDLDRNGERAGHVAGGRVPAHGTYSARRARTARLRSGLGGVLSTASAWPVERAARGRRRQAVGAGTRLVQRRRQ